MFVPEKASIHARLLKGGLCLANSGLAERLSKRIKNIIKTVLTTKATKND
jgi:hypothetical protein